MCDAWLLLHSGRPAGIVAQDTDGLLRLSQISSRHNGGRLVVGADLKPNRTPVYELDKVPCLDFGYGTIQQTAAHVFAMSRVTPPSGLMAQRR